VAVHGDWRSRSSRYSPSGCSEALNKVYIMHVSNDNNQTSIRKYQTASIQKTSPVFTDSQQLLSSHSVNNSKLSLQSLNTEKKYQAMASNTTPNTTAIDKSKPYFPVAGLANDGWSNEDEATATCFCGAVQLAAVSFTF
jgi:hypothetical protein